MDLLRNNQQTLLDELGSAVRRNAEAYRSAATTEELKNDDSVFLTIAKEREEIAEKVDTRLKELETLPSAPDGDREDIKQLLNHLKSFFSQDTEKKVIRQRLRAEKELLSLMEKMVECKELKKHQDLIKDLKRHIRIVMDSLKTLLKNRDG